MSRTLAITAAIAFALGIALGGWSPAVAIGGALTSLAVAAIATRLAPLGWSTVVLIASVAGGALVGAADARWVEAIPEPPPSPPVWGVVTDVRTRGDRVQVIIAPDRHPDHRIGLWTQGHPAGVWPGARVRAVGRIRPLAPADEPGGWDAAAHGRALGVAWQGIGAVDVIAPGRPLGRLVVDTTARARHALDRTRHPFGAAVLTGLLLGDRAAVPPSARDALRAVGTGHLLAVSGLHVGGLAALVVAGLAGIARRFGAVEPIRWALVGGLPAVIALVALAGFPVGACRAGLMIGLYLVGRALGRRPDAVVLLAIAAIGLMGGRPSAASSAGFQLSFGAVGALLAFGGHRGVRGAAVASIVAAAATAPIEAWHFGTIAPASPIANLLLCPVVSIALVPLGLVGLVLSPLTGIPLDLAAMGAEVMVAVAETIRDASGGALIVGRWAAPALLVPLVALWALRAAGIRWALPPAIALLGVSLTLRPSGTTVDFLPVGQGDAIVVRSAGRAMLVDAGPEVTGFRLVGALCRAGIDALDSVWISHGHPDHFAGLPSVLAAMPVGAVWFNGRHRDSVSWRRLRAVIARHGVPLRPAIDHRFRLGEATIDVIAPASDAARENDASVVVRVDGAAGSVLLTGDLEAEGEARLLDAHVRPVTVLKAPHHGSKTSSGDALLDAACPSAVVYTVGRHNRHGLPHPDVVDRYAARGIPGFRTDRHGRTTVRLDRGPTITPWRGASIALPPHRCPSPPPEAP